MGRGRRGLRLRRSIGDRAQRVDHARPHLVVLKRVERPLGLFGRQHIGVSRGCGCPGRIFGRVPGGIAALSARGECKHYAGKQDRGEKFVRHEGLFFMCALYMHDSKPESLVAFAPASCRIAPFRRRDVSKVCHGGGVLLAFTAPQKCRSDYSPNVPTPRIGCCCTIAPLRASRWTSHASALSRRDAPELCKYSSPKTEGAGKAGCPLHPRPRVVCSKHAR